ncbi:hypothetical protein BOTBODRAFT_182136 [Botryobasidium botryosum FD-172 SS1]|uniref:Uncharacterized protein n=1 Tax=Botryobasidium botryosum (strain FD-172 SS1) TaxID=930990 RepID=A0A067LRQ4_BOTB1|nr:hypothetical protein BOTBODRAFT_182136 [Botryobasidium botryosum FD-172 SS1]
MEGQKPAWLIQKEKDRAEAKKKQKTECANVAQDSDLGTESCALAQSSISHPDENNPAVAMNTTSTPALISSLFYYDSAATSPSRHTKATSKSSPLFLPAQSKASPATPST